MQERVGRRLPLEAEARGLDAVDAGIEQIGEARRLQNGHGVLAGGYHRGLEARRPQATYERDRTVEHLDALLRQKFAEERVLAVAKAANSLALRRIVRLALRQDDAARAEEITHAVEPGLAVHVPEVVAFDVEGTECLSRAGGAAREERVEKPLPGGGVHGRRSCDHTIEVERGTVECDKVDDGTILDRVAELVCHCRTPVAFVPIRMPVLIPSQRTAGLIPSPSPRLSAWPRLVRPRAGPNSPPQRPPGRRPR